MGGHDGEHEDVRDGSSRKDASGGGMAMHGANLKRRFFASLVLTVPILLLSSPMGMALPIMLAFPGSDGVVAALATVLFVYGGWPFLRGAAERFLSRSAAASIKECKLPKNSGRGRIFPVLSSRAAPARGAFSAVRVPISRSAEKRGRKDHCFKMIFLISSTSFAIFSLSLISSSTLSREYMMVV